MIFKRRTTAPLLVLIFFSVTIDALDKQCADPVLVLSSRILTNDALPKRFRTMQDKVNQEKGVVVSTKGLKRMKVSGSSEITPKNIGNIIALLHKKSAEKITVLDLRRESHSWINGLPYYWLSSPDHLFTFCVDCYNDGKSVVQIEKDEMHRAAKLMNACQATIYDFSHGQYPFVPTATAKTIAIEHAVLTEKDLVMLAGLEYLRLPISDDHAPSWSVIDQLVNYYRLHPDYWLHAHCNEGHGRTTTILAMLDILYNAKIVDFDSIILRQKLLGSGGADLFDVNAEGLRVRDEFEYRLALLKNFYRYCKENTDNFATPFSGWASQHGLHENRVSGCGSAHNEQEQ